MRTRKCFLWAVAIIAAIPGAGAFAQTAHKARACDSPEYRRFDFWVGKWDVYPAGSNRLVSHSLIEPVYDGCAIRENWSPLAPGGDGGSLSAYVPERKAWRQTWVDSSGAWVDFVGGWNGSAMVLAGFWKDVLGPGKGALVRMTYTWNRDGSVRQLGEASRDGGKTWAPNFDLIYRRAKP